jgi:hypothetical protein
MEDFEFLIRPSSVGPDGQEQDEATDPTSPWPLHYSLLFIV